MTGNDSTSLVRASAQELQEPNAFTCPSCGLCFVDEDGCCKTCGHDTEPIYSKLVAAAEARGRQQAEQARDEAQASEQRQYDQSVEATVRMLQAEQRVATLTQALKDYGRHKDGCPRSVSYTHLRAH